jgi:putative endopeptidase
MSSVRRLAAAVATALASAAHAGVDPTAMDRSANPCTDFYRFANGAWLDAAPIPPDLSRWGSFDALTRASEEILRKAMEEAANAPLPPPGSSRRIAIDYYRSGMDEAAIARAGIAPVTPLLGRAAAIEKAADLARVLGEIHAFDVEPGFAFSVSPDAKDSSVYLAALAQGGLGLPDRDYYFLEDERSRGIRESYRKHIARVLAVGGPADAAEADAARVFQLETELARASMTAVERRDVDKTYNKITLAELERAAPGFAWREYFAALGAPAIERVNVQQPAYLARFAELAASRPAAEWSAYVRWQVLRAASDKLHPAYESLHFDFFERVLTGKVEPAQRAKRVLMVIGGRFGNAPLAEGLGQIYVDRAFPPEAKARMLVMVDDIKAALGERLKAVEWMTEETRAVSLQKLEAMRPRIGYPDRWRDLSTAEVGTKPFAENWLAAGRFAHRRDLGRIGKPVDREEWFSSPHIVNAFYSSSRNEIVFPAGILQPPFFDLKADDAANYGGIGMVIGHEITHGFDDRGRRFDKDGNLRDWWSAEDSRRYRERAKKVESQYGAYTAVDGIKVNGALTLGENISDIGGTRIAYLALQKALARNPQGSRGGFTPEQRFFISLGNIWRASMRPEYERLRLRTDSHSLPPLRVRGIIANMPEFARAFSCEPAKVLLGDNEMANIW